MDDEPDLRAILRAQRRALMLKIALAAGVFLVIFAASVHKPLLGFVDGWLHGDHDLLGRSLWAPPELPADPGAIDGVDLHRVHAELIPGWFIVLARLDPESPRVQEALGALQEGVAGSPQLLAIVSELHTLVAEDPWANSDRIFALTDAWNVHLRALGQPWHLESNVVDMGSGPFFYAKSYRVEADLVVPVEGIDTPLKVLRRVDNTNVRESYLGMVVQGQEQALVMVDRVRELALDELWPLMDPALDPELSAYEAAFATAVRAEVLGGFAPEHQRVLSRTARARFELMSVASAMELRQACGGGLRVLQVPWQGMDASELDGLEQLARRDAHQACPSVTLGEVDRLREATAAVRAEAELEPALESLAAWAARGTAVHELRHVADTRAHGEGRLPCTGCDELSVAAVREASAYLASTAWSRARASALYQACSQTSGAHAAAVDWLGDRLGGACEGPPVDLGERAEALEAELFGARGSIVLPPGWPERLPVR